METDTLYVSPLIIFIMVPLNSAFKAMSEMLEISKYFIFLRFAPHHINDLLECQPKCQVDGIGVVEDRPLQLIIVL